MQRYCTELTERLLKSLDKEYNVVDMGAVVDVITALEKTTITKEVLEITRLGKYINELRRKTNNDALAKRAKDLVRRWRDMVLPSANTTPQPTPADPAPQALNGTKPQSPALRGLKPHSPAIRSLKPHSPALKAFKPHSPLLRDATPTKQVLSPASSLHSEHSRSPNPTPPKHHHHHHHQQHHHQKPPLSCPAPTTTTASTTNHRPNTDVSPKPVLASTQNHTIEAVPRTHSSNKRLRKEDSSPAGSPPTPPSATSKSQINDTPVSRLEPTAKRQRLNGEQTSLSVTRLTEPSANNNAPTTGRSTSNNSSRPTTLNQQVPSPRESERPIDRLTETRSISAGRDIAGETTATAPSGPKKRGRKKGSKSLKNQTLPEDRVKEKLASISRNPKLKTTQELLADLQARGSNSASLGTGSTTTLTSRSTEPPSTEEILRSSVGNDDRPLSSRYLRASREKTSSQRASSGRDGGTTNFGDTTKSRAKASAVGGTAGRRWESSRKSDDGDDSQQSHVDVDGISRTGELTVEEILAKLPPLDRDAISWSDCEEEIPEEEADGAAEENGKEITEDDVDRLHGECVEGLNGNFQMKMKITSADENDETRAADDRARAEKVDDIRASDEWSIADVKKKGVYRRLGANEDDREFREWHEMLARPSYDGQILHILPYVIID